MAGVQIRAITGDSRETITGLGIEANLISNEELDDPYVCMTGQELISACQIEKNIELSEALVRLNERKTRIINSL